MSTRTDIATLAAVLSLRACAAFSRPEAAIYDSLPLGAEWEMAYSPSFFAGGECPDFKGVRVEKAVPGYWEDMGESFRRAGMADGFKPNPDYRIQKLPIGGRALDTTIPGVSGTFFYRRKVELPGPRPASIAFTEVRNSVSVFLNGGFAGRHEGFSTPFQIDLPLELQKKGENEIILAVSNNPNKGYNGGEVSGLTTRALFASTGGVGGPVELRFPKSSISDVYATTAADLKSFTIHATNPGGEKFAYEITDGAGATVAKGEADGDITLPTEGFTFWSPENPALYKVLISTDKGSACRTFGIRRLAADGERFRLNGEWTYLRGITEHCYFAETIHPPRDLEYYRRITKIRKELGFNFLRFHTWVPPEEYLQAMDELGMLVHIESPNFVPLDEYRRIIAFARRHPCVVIYCTGNETQIDGRAEKYLEQVARAVHEGTDALFSPMSAMRGVEYMLYSGREKLASKPFLHNPGRMARLSKFCDMYSSYQLGATSYNSLNGPSAAQIDKWGDAYLGKPRVSHEICIDGSFADLSLEGRYPAGSPIVATGLFSGIRAALDAKGLLPRAEAYRRNSEEWMRRVRKFAFEKIRSCRRVAGYDFLGDINTHWHTFGYCVGMMDEFYRLKTSETAENVRRYNSAAVLLCSLGSDFNVWAGTRKTVGFSVSNFERDMEGGRLAVRLSDATGGTLWEEERAVGALPGGEVSPLGDFAVEIPNCASPRKLKLEARLFRGGENPAASNEWELYAFEPFADTLKRPGVRILHAIGKDGLLKAMENGERVLLFGAGPFKSKKTTWRIGLAGRCGGNYATVIKPDHPALAGMPHDGWCGWQFRRLFEGGRAVQLEADVPFDPIIDVAASDKYPIRQSVLFEYKVGKGRLLVCPLNFGSKPEDPAAAWLRRRLADYAASDAFDPRLSITPRQLAAVIDAPLADAEKNTNSAWNPNDPASRAR